MSNPPVLHYAKVRNSQLVVYPSFELFDTNRGHHKNSAANLEKPKPKGTISKKASKRMSEVIEVWTNSVRAKLKQAKKPKKLLWQHITFVTLTLSSTQLHSDKYIKREMLNRFLIDIQRNCGVVNYLWKAEPQKNGNLHFHILIDKYIHWRVVRNRWNKIQADHGYIQKFEDKHGHVDPNSTDIHSLTKINDIGSYMGKYMGKDNGIDDRLIDGRVWGMSDSLRNCASYTVFLDEVHQELCTELKKAKGVPYYSQDFFEIFAGDWKKVLKEKFPAIVDDIEEHFLQQAEIIASNYIPPPKKIPQKTVFKQKSTQLTLHLPEFHQTVKE